MIPLGHDNSAVCLGGGGALVAVESRSGRLDGSSVCRAGVRGGGRKGGGYAW